MTKRYRETGPEYVRLTYKPYGERLPVSVWAEVGPVDGDVHLFWELNERAERQCYILVVRWEKRTKPARYNLDTDKLEVVPIKERVK